MSRRDYIEAARIVREADYLTPQARARLVSDLITFFADDNPRFSPSRFRDACEPEPEPEGAMRTLGLEHGRAAATWLLDGNSTEDQARMLLRGLEDGDPAVMDALPTPPTGEWAGDPTGEDLIAEAGLEVPAKSDAVDQLWFAYCEGWGEGVQQGADAEARAFLGAEQ